MATFGSYGNLGGELVSVVEINQSVTCPVTVAVSGTFYTVPAGRYALVCHRYGSPIPSSSPPSFINRNLTGSVATSAIVAVDNSYILNEGETITYFANSSSGTQFLTYGCVIFEYRKP